MDFAAQRVTVANVRLLHDAYSGYPYEIITVRPIGDACETPRAPPSAAVPAGLHLPEGTFANASIPFEGVYPVAAGDGCCFLSDRAVFGVRAPRAARNLRFTIYTLNYPQVPPQHLTFLIDGKTALRSGVLPKGIVSTVDVPLPSGSRGKPALRVEIEATSFVPKEIGINGEPRRLSVVLSSVTAGAAATPSPVAAAATRVALGNAAASAAPPTTYDFTASARPLRVPDGLFVDDSSGCCFAGKRVTFDLSIPPGSTQVNVTLYPPDLPKHPGQAASMIATFNGKHPITVNGLIPGALKTYAIPLPAAVRTKTRLALTLAFPQTFVPRDEGINGDTRTLSVVIRSVAFAR